MKVLIADKFPATHLRRLEESGHECAFHPDLGAGDLARALGASEALVVRSTRVTEETLRAGERLELVIRAGAGTNTIDTEAASALGVSVCNVPGKNAVAVAELTLGLLIALDRRIADNVADLRAGRWDKKRYSEARGLLGARLGIVGLGAIGMAVAERAHAFGLRVGVLAKRRAPDIEARLEALGVSRAPSIEALAAESDILTFHLPRPRRAGGCSARSCSGTCATGPSSSTPPAATSSTRRPCWPRSRRRTSGWGWTSTRTSRRAGAQTSRARSRGIPTCTAPTTSAPPRIRPSPPSRTAWWRSWKRTGAVKYAIA